MWLKCEIQVIHAYDGLLWIPPQLSAWDDGTCCIQLDNNAVPEHHISLIHYTYEGIHSSNKALVAHFDLLRPSKEMDLVWAMVTAKEASEDASPSTNTAGRGTGVNGRIFMVDLKVGDTVWLPGKRDSSMCTIVTVARSKFWLNSDPKKLTGRSGRSIAIAVNKWLKQQALTGPGDIVVSIPLRDEITGLSSEDLYIFVATYAQLPPANGAHTMFNILEHVVHTYLGGQTLRVGEAQKVKDAVRPYLAKEKALVKKTSDKDARLKKGESAPRRSRLKKQSKSASVRGSCWRSHFRRSRRGGRHQRRGLVSM